MPMGFINRFVARLGCLLVQAELVDFVSAQAMRSPWAR